MGTVSLLISIIGGVIGAVGGALGIYSFFEGRQREKKEWNVFLEILPNLMTGSRWVPGDDKEYLRLAEKWVQLGRLERMHDEHHGLAYMLPPRQEKNS